MAFVSDALILAQVLVNLIVRLLAAVGFEVIGIEVASEHPTELSHAITVELVLVLLVGGAGCPGLEGFGGDAESFGDLDHVVEV